MENVNRPQSTAYGAKWLPDPSRDYSGTDIITAASSMTASGVLFSKLKDAKLDDKTVKQFSIMAGNQDPYEISDSHWNGIKRSVITDIIPSFQQQRQQEGLPEYSPKEIVYLFGAESLQDFANRSEQIDRVAKSSEVFREHPLGTFASATAISVFEPWNIASMPLALVNAGSRAASAARLAALGAGIAGAEEIVLRSDDPNRTLGMSLSSVALAGTINGALGTYLSRSKKLETEQLRQIEKEIRSIDQEANVVIDIDTPALGAVDETINLNLIESARELNKALDGVQGVGPKTVEKILEARARRPEGRFNSLDDIVDDSMDAATVRRINKLIESKRFHVSSATNSESANDIVGAYGLEKIAAISSPLVRLLRSPFPEVKRAAEELLDNPLLTTNNLKGIPSPIALESIINQNRRLGNDLIDDLESNYYSYLFPDGTGGDFARQRGGRVFRQVGQLTKNLLTANVDQLRKSPTSIPGKKSFDQFKLSVLEHYTGARVSKDPNVINAAKSYGKFFDAKADDVKDLLIRLNGGDVSKVTWIKNVKYTHRIYNKRVIAENPEAFENFLVDQLVKKNGSIRNVETELQASMDEIRASFRQSIDNLAKSPEERIELEKVFTPNKRGASHNRYWHFIDDADLYRTDFVVKDIEAITNSYITNVLADVSFYRKYGTLQPKEVIRNLEAKIKTEGATPEQVSSLRDELRTLEGMMDRVRGTYLDPTSPIPGGVTQNTIDTIKKYNNLRLGAGFMIKSLPDIGRSVMFLGFAKAFGPMLQSHVLRNQAALQMYKRSARELRSLNVANEINFSSIISTLTNTHVNSFSGNKITDIVGKNNNAMFILNGLSLWNEYMKKNAGIGILDELIESARKSKAGKLSADKQANLAKMGLSKDDLAGLLAEFEKHGQSYKGINVMNFESWSKEALDRTGPLGLSLADRVQLAVKKEVDTIIVTPGVGDTPLIMENSWVSLFTQYRSFPIASMVRQTLPLAQNFNSNAFAGLMVSVSAAFVANQFMSYARGSDAGESTWGELLYEALEDTGNLSTIGEFANYTQMISSGNPMVLGPVGTLPQDIFKVQSGLANEAGMTPYEERALARLTPYAGLLTILSALPRGAGDMAEQALTEIQDGF